MKDFKKYINFLVVLLLALSLLGCASTQSWKVEQGDSTKSFWRDQVQYPYPVKYAQARDSQGVMWEIGYMDEYAGKEANPQTLILIHGKGAFGGYFGNVMKVALENGLRVVVPDIPHYGKSIPGNIDKPLTRTLEDTREAIYDLVVNQLGIKKATYLGHSLGGQWVLGYTLKYPSAVEKIILEAPGGLEEYPTIVRIPIAKDKIIEVPFFSPSYLRDLDTWRKVHGNALAGEYKKTADDIRLWNYFKMRDPKTGEIRSSPTGYFLKEDPYAEFVTQVREKMITGNKKEYDNYVVTFIRDIYTLGVEIRREDPLSITKRTKNIKVPILLLFGNKEPFIPVKFLSGLSDLKKEVIQPFYNDLKTEGNPPVVKVYPDAGHFIHTDVADEFSRDVVDFTIKGYISTPSNVESF